MLFKDHFILKLNNKIKTCQDCKLKDNPGPVPGYGGADAYVMFISDAPKAEDVARGIPFTGIAKQRMVNAISDIGLKKGEYYFTYLVKHQLTDGAKPDIYAHRPCLNLLLEEIELINPHVICSMGYYVTNFLMEAYEMETKGKQLKELHGNAYIIPGKKYNRSKNIKSRKEPRPKRYLIPTWSPAVENPIMNQDFSTDVKTIKHVAQMQVLLFD